VWLDRGELEKLLSAGREEAQAQSQVHERFEREVDSFQRDPDAWKRSHPYDPGEKRYRYEGDDYYRHKKRKKGFDIFDIFD
jgi:Zn-finger nucleic acid-binding protein